jgi:RNA recognition motif-containing protein
VQLIFCNIQESTSVQELIDFAESMLKAGLGRFRETGIQHCEIMEITDQDSLDVSYFGLMTFADPDRANRAIRVLNGKKLMGKPIKVREYKHRSPGDRRVSRDTQGLNRPEDRRRKNLQVRYRRARR